MSAFNDFLTWLASDVLCSDREADPDMEDPSAALAAGAGRLHLERADAAGLNRPGN